MSKAKEGRADRAKGKAKRKGRSGADGARPGSAWSAAPADAHEWVSFEDPQEARTWRFDVTFLSSPWQCIYGHGCQGVLTGRAPERAEGCCSYGAHFTDDDDAARVQAAARTLTPDQWQFAARGARGVLARRRPGQPATTRLVDGACIFLNRPGFPGGAGCALHRGAVDRGVHPMELKPDVCWQLPLRREDVTQADGSVVSTVSQWERSHWGAGGEEFAWWCTEAPEAFAGGSPVWRHMRAELESLVGADIYALLGAYMKGREVAGALLPHPVVRRRA